MCEDSFTQWGPGRLKSAVLLCLQVAIRVPAHTTAGPRRVITQRGPAIVVVIEGKEGTYE